MRLVYAGAPLIRAMPFSRRYRLEEELEVRWLVGDEERRFTVEKGYLTDGASIPRALWSLIGSPYLPEFITAAIVHDKMCDLGWDVEEMSRLFFLLLRDSNVPTLAAKTMWRAVYVYKEYFSTGSKVDANKSRG